MSDDNISDSSSDDKINIIEPSSKRPRKDEQNLYDIDQEYYDNLFDREYIFLKPKIRTLDDLIELGKCYNDKNDYNIDMRLLNKIVPALQDLNNMIGMEKVKNDIIDHVIYYILNLEYKNNDYLHTIIDGPPGVGKTELAKILGKIYLGLGFLRNNIFKKVSRSDMVAKYVGQTALKTQDLINSCKGGVMFIDEAYSLGNEHSDSFSKEAIDTLNLNLSDLKSDFICIVAGYSRDLDKYFFSTNSGLKSRFSIRFQIDPYSYKELYKIFKNIVFKNGWSLCDNVNNKFFRTHYDKFKAYGRDMDRLFMCCKRTHARRYINNPESIKKCITNEDMENGIRFFIINN